jgi:hypothetical protein
MVTIRFPDLMPARPQGIPEYPGAPKKETAIFPLLSTKSEKEKMR